MTPKISRRQMLKMMAAAAGGSALVFANRIGALISQAQTTDDFITFLPIVTRSDRPTPPPPTNSRVVHIHNPRVSNWTDNATDYRYWNYVNQGEIDTMVDQGMLWLTGADNLYDAWKAVLPSYQVGQKIAIKVSFNNTDQEQECADNSIGQIDGIIEPVNAIIRGLKTIGVAEADIHIYETIRTLPPHFVDGCDYPGVKFYDRGGCASLTNTFTSSDPNAVVQFNPPAGDPAPPTLRINDVLIGATYLINVPIMKAHDMAGWSLALKNHYGTTQKPGGLHYWSSLNSPYFTPTYSPIVDLYRNPHIAGKTILTVADGIFSAMHHTAPPEKWVSFGNNYPKSLFFSRDPVAIDCVMGDLLTVERPQIPQIAADHLVLAQAYGLGTFERGNPWANPASSGYSQIDYQKIEL